MQDEDSTSIAVAAEVEAAGGAADDPLAAADLESPMTDDPSSMEPKEPAAADPGATERSGPPPCESLPLTQRVEALLLCSDRPVTDARIVEILGLDQIESRGKGQVETVRRDAVTKVHAAIAELNQQYASAGRTFRIEAVAGGRQILTLPAFGPIMARLRAARAEGRLSPAALETLAIVAYRQPILRADIESIRGVACGEVLRTLMERRLVRIVGRSEELGRPMLYGTTREFLRAFGLARIDDLPTANDGRASGPA